MMADVGARPPDYNLRRTSSPLCSGYELQLPRILGCCNVQRHGL